MTEGAWHALAGIDKERVTRWLVGHVSRLVPPVGFDLISGGRSNLTYRLTDAAGAVYALRRPPTGGVLATAHDMSREWRFISAMAPTAVPVAVPLAYCADAGVTGAEFYVMGYVEGQVLSDRDAGLALAPEARATAGDNACLRSRSPSSYVPSRHRRSPRASRLTRTSSLDSPSRRRLVASPFARMGPAFAYRPRFM